MKTVYIAGWMRSGSTLLTRLLGAQRGAFAIGELRGFWRDTGRGGLCSCREPIVDCPVWRAALAVVHGEHGIGPADHARLAAMADEQIRMRHVPGLLRAVRNGSVETASPDLNELARVTRTLVEAAGRAVDASYVIDSSKLVSTALFDAFALDEDLRMVHLVREAVGVAASENRTRDKPKGNDEFLPSGQTVARSALWWNFANATALPARRLARSYAYVRYEDLVNDTGGVLRRIGESADIEIDPSSVDRPEPAGAAHIISANPVRFDDRPRSLSPDMRWKSELTTAQKWGVRAATAPLRMLMEATR